MAPPAAGPVSMSNEVLFPSSRDIPLGRPRQPSSAADQMYKVVEEVNSHLTYPKGDHRISHAIEYRDQDDDAHYPDHAPLATRTFVVFSMRPFQPSTAEIRSIVRVGLHHEVVERIGNNGVGRSEWYCTDPTRKKHPIAFHQVSSYELETNHVGSCYFAVQATGNGAVAPTPSDVIRGTSTIGMLWDFHPTKDSAEEKRSMITCAHSFFNPTLVYAYRNAVILGRYFHLKGPQVLPHESHLAVNVCRPECGFCGGRGEGAPGCAHVCLSQYTAWLENPQVSKEEAAERLAVTRFNDDVERGVHKRANEEKYARQYATEAEEATILGAGITPVERLGKKVLLPIRSNLAQPSEGGLPQGGSIADGDVALVELADDAQVLRVDLKAGAQYLARQMTAEISLASHLFSSVQHWLRLRAWRMRRGLAALSQVVGISNNIATNDHMSAVENTFMVGKGAKSGWIMLKVDRAYLDDPASWEASPVWPFHGTTNGDSGMTFWIISQRNASNQRHLMLAGQLYGSDKAQSGRNYRQLGTTSTIRRPNFVMQAVEQIARRIPNRTQFAHAKGHEPFHLNPHLTGVWPEA